MTHKLLILPLALGALMLGACQKEGGAEKVGEKIDNAAKKTGDAVKDAAKKVEQSTDPKKDQK